VNCRPDSAKRGWDLYRASDPPLPRATINEQLVAAGLDPVSDRMYRHYRRLTSHRFVDYLPINELDMLLKLRLRKAS
jgi:hypothetical protein